MTKLQEQLKQLHEQDQKALAWIVMAICRQCETPATKPLNDATEAFLKGEIDSTDLIIARLCSPGVDKDVARCASWYASYYYKEDAIKCVEAAAKALGVDPTDLLNQHLNPTAASVKGN